MATNTIITPLQITRKALRILHQKANFIGSVNRQYDSQYARSGAKIGKLLNIRMPSRYTVRTGAPLSAQDHYERSTPLYVSSQIGVDVSFTTADLTMDLDDFGQRFLEPAMAQLAAHLDYTCMTLAKNRTFNYVGTTTTSGQITYKTFQQGGQRLTENLAPSDMRYAVLNPQSIVEFNDAVKGLYHSSENIESLYREGTMGRTGGFTVMENSLLPTHTTGSFAGSPVTTGTGQGLGTTTANSWVSQTTMSITGATSTTDLKAGDIITFSGVYAIHPESKVNLGRLQPFVVQSAVTLTSSGTTYGVTVKPGLIWGNGNAYRNVSFSGVSDTSGLTVTLIGNVSTAYGQNLQFHKDAFVFATADLDDVSQYGAWGARDVQDGISMRIAKQYDISSDTIPCRIDILYGFAELYPELACRNWHTL